MSVISEQLRAQVMARAESRCEYFLLPTQGQVGRFPIDHVNPRINGGATDLANLALACPHCNAAKWKHTHGLAPETEESVPIFNPRAMVWAQHFQWPDEDPCVIKGITACGRATVNRLRLNHADMVLIRRLARRLGVMKTELQ